MAYELFHDDCLKWLSQREDNSIHAVVTDPPFGMREYTPKELSKLRAGRGGIWRIPPKIGGTKRAPLPRFTVLTDADIKAVAEFFYKWGLEIVRVLVPGGHLFIASNPLISHVIYCALEKAGLEKRGEIIRVVRTLRGGDRPKGYEEAYKEVSVIPRACYEPWGLFRKPLEGKVADNLRKWGTGALRRWQVDKPFPDLIYSTRTPKEEKAIAPHPSLKPQKFMRLLVYASLPLGKGIVLDPFMGAGSTIAAAEAVGYDSIGIEIDKEYFKIAQEAIPKLSSISTGLPFETKAMPLELE
ncbi:MAG TPA: site-specific DNA-methyltransferase [Candidatus Aenigmarchaeota archaeon]|nr:site-specific DNA-methyltransferase [Candidatus Aenigmarchaeota archaeon]